MSSVVRCDWSGDDPLMVAYHDGEWGEPVHDDRLMFEFVVLEGAQAGLSWMTILRKREGYREAFAEFDIEKVARFTSADIERLLTNPAIVRNRQKVESTVANAKATLDVRKEYGSLSEYMWGFVGGQTIENRWKRMGEIPAKTLESETMSKEMKKRGFRFFGPTIAYAHMQATGMVNDHIVTCFRYPELTH